jgi:DNA replication protein DnaC
MDTKEQITAYCRKFRTAGISKQLELLVKQAENEAVGFMQFTLLLLRAEAEHRHHNDVNRRRKVARLPSNNDLDRYDKSFDNGVPKNRLNQLRELNWLDQGYNIMLMGPSGTGKTFIAGGLCADAIDKGYKAYFRTMEELVNMLKMKDIIRSATADYKRLAKADLIVIDDIMLFPVEKNQAVALFVTAL